jgi:hypothetical protein
MEDLLYSPRAALMFLAIVFGLVFSRGCGLTGQRPRRG